jgi:hypothetical protein
MSLTSSRLPYHKARQAEVMSALCGPSCDSPSVTSLGYVAKRQLLQNPTLATPGGGRAKEGKEA